MHIQYFYCYIHPGLRVSNPNLWTVAEIRWMGYPRWKVGWRVVSSLKWSCDLCRRLKLSSVNWRLVSSVRVRLDCRTSTGASYRVCWPVTSVLLEYAQLISLSSSEKLFPVGGSLVVPSLRLVCTRRFMFISTWYKVWTSRIYQLAFWWKSII